MPDIVASRKRPVIGITIAWVMLWWSNEWILDWNTGQSHWFCVYHARLWILLICIHRHPDPTSKIAYHIRTIWVRLRPYHVEYTSSRPITEVKQRRARLVLGWVTALGIPSVVSFFVVPGSPALIFVSASERVRALFNLSRNLSSPISRSLAFRMFQDHVSHLAW